VIFFAKIEMALVMSTPSVCNKIVDRRIERALAVMSSTHERLGAESLLGLLCPFVLRGMLTALHEPILCTIQQESEVLLSFELQLLSDDELKAGIMGYTPHVSIDVKNQMYWDLQIRFSGAVHGLQTESFWMGLPRATPAERTLIPDEDGVKVLDVINCKTYVSSSKIASFVRLTHTNGSSNLPIFYIKFSVDICHEMRDPDFAQTDSEDE